MRTRNVPTLADSGFRRALPPTPPADLAPVTFVWWAESPKGRESTHTYAYTVNRLAFSGKSHRSDDGTLREIRVPAAAFTASTYELYESLRSRQNSLVPRVPAGYVWQGPFLAHETPAPVHETDDFKFTAPLHSAGEPPCKWNSTKKGELAARLARAVLSNRKGALV